MRALSVALACCLAALLIPLRARAVEREAIDRAIASVVQVFVPLADGGTASGSGSVLTRDGYILTNMHVVADLSSGALESVLTYGGERGVVQIGVVEGVELPPAVRYLARVEDRDPDLDLALLRVVALADQRPLPADFALTPIQLGDSDQVRLGDDIAVIGFPGLGGESVTYTRGAVAGFLTGPDGRVAWIKTDAEVNKGNSGGMAIDDAGRLVGVPTEGRWGRGDAESGFTFGKLSLLRPIDRAVERFGSRLGLARIEPTRLPGAASPSPPASPTVAATPTLATGARALEILDLAMARALEPRTQAPADRTLVFPPSDHVIYCAVRLRGGQPQTVVEAIWRKGGEEIVRTPVVLQGGEDGWLAFSLTVDEDLPVGDDYAVDLAVDGAVVRNLAFSVW